MFNFDEEKNLDLSCDDTVEGFLGVSRTKSVEKLLSAVEKNINKKCKSVEDCDVYLEKITAEGKKFNESMKALADAAKAFKEGKIDKKELNDQVKPIIKDLKGSCCSLKLGDLAKDEKNITDDELAALKEFIEGAKKIIEAKKASIAGDEAQEGCESTITGIDEFIASCESMIISEIDGSNTMVTIGEESYDIASQASEFMLACEAALYENLLAAEGFNYDRKEEYKKILDDAKAMYKEAKVCAKNGDEAGTKAAINKLIEYIKESKKIFDEKIKEGTVTDAVIGYFAYALRAYGILLLSLIPTLGLSYMVVTVKSWVEEIMIIINAIKKSDSLTASDFNKYTKALSHNMDIAIKYYSEAGKKLSIKAAKKAAKEEMKEEPAGESLIFEDFDNLIF